MNREIAGRDHPGGVSLDEADMAEIDSRVAARADELMLAAEADLVVAGEIAEYSPDLGALFANIASLVRDLRAPADLPNPVLSPADRISRFLVEWAKLVGPLANDMAESERDRIEANFIAECLS